MPDHRAKPGALFKGLLQARGYSLRATLLVTSAVSLGFAVWSATTVRLLGLLAGLGCFAVLMALGLVAQYVAQRSGAAERDRIREEEMQAEVSLWPRRKRIAYLFLMLGIGIGVLVLRSLRPV